MIMLCTICSRQIGQYAYLALALFLAVMLILSVALHYQFGATFFTILLSLVTVLYCIIGLVFLVVAVVGHDG